MSFIQNIHIFETNPPTYPQNKFYRLSVKPSLDVVCVANWNGYHRAPDNRGKQTASSHNFAMLPSTSTSSKNACNGGKGRIENTNSRKRREIKKQNDPDGERERAKKRQTCKKSVEKTEKWWIQKFISFFVRIFSLFYRSRIWIRTS